jgi:2-polyprenyl-6-methoxyphenol hydroxylase-like FAD-dependent oxidoreductase
MTPHLGQGACQAIEDAVVLASVAGPGTPAETAPGTGSVPDLAAYTSARLSRTRMVAKGSYRATRLSGMTSRPAIALRNTGVLLAGRLVPGLMLRQMDPLASWTPPPVPAP